MSDQKPKKVIIEAALFMSDKPVTRAELAKIAGIQEDEVNGFIDELRSDYSNRGFEIIETDGEYVMKVKQDLASQVSHLTPYADLSPGPLRTLAIVAFKQPVKQSDIVFVQGNRVYDYIKELETRGLISGKRVGKTKIFTTTQEFNEYFGTPIEKVREIAEKLKKAVGETNQVDDPKKKKKKDGNVIQEELEKYFTENRHVEEEPKKDNPNPENVDE